MKQHTGKLRFIILWLIRPVLSLMIAGWLSRDLFYPKEANRRGSADNIAHRMLPVILLSALMTILCVSFGSWAPDDDWHVIKDISGWSIIIFALVALYKFIVKLFRRKPILACQWIFPVIVFWTLHSLVNFNFICDQLDRAKFFLNEKYYDKIVQDVSARPGKTKYISIYWGTTGSDVSSLIYDESDRIGTIQGAQERYLRAKDLESGDFVRSAKRLKSHYYVVVIHYESTYYGDNRNAKVGEVDID